MLFIITDAGVPYQVTIVASTGAGRGVESSQMFFTHELIPSKSPENVTYKRSGTTISISWHPLTIFEARGLPYYKVTMMLYSLVGSRIARQSNDDGITSIVTNKTDVLIKDLDSDVDYFLIVAVGTSSGEVAAPGS